MALTLFDINPGYIFLPSLSAERHDNVRISSNNGVVDSYVETSRFPVSSSVACVALGNVQIPGKAEPNNAYVISWSGHYEGGTMADDYLVDDVLTAWYDGAGEWYFSTFVKNSG